MKTILLSSLALFLTLIVQAQPICGDLFQLSGNVTTSCGDPLSGIQIVIDAELPEYPQSTTSNTDGAYDGMCHVPNQQYILQANSDVDYQNGVSSLDKVLIERHVLGIQPLTDVYQLIAADVNNDGNITAADIAELDQLILGQILTFSNSPSWKCFDAKTLDPSDISTFNEQIVINDLDQDHNDIDWIAVKIGDVNCSASTNNNNTGDCNDGYRIGGLVFDVCDQPIDLKIEYYLDSDQDGYPKESTHSAVYNLDCHAGNQDYSLYLTSNDNYLNGVTTLDLVLIERHILGQELFTEGWQYIAADINKDGNVTSFDLVELEKLILQEYTELPDNASYRFFDASYELAIDNPNSFVEVMEISNLNSDQLGLDWVAVKIGDVNGTSGAGCVTSSTTDNQVSGFQVYQNVPNPVKMEAAIKFVIPTSGMVSLDFYSITGRKLYSVAELYQQGEHSFNLDNTVIAGFKPGIYCYAISFNNSVITKKLVVE